MGIDDSTLSTPTDQDFKNGQRADATPAGLGDNIANWDPAFLQDIHAVILVSGDTHKSVDKKFQQVKDIFGVGSAKSSIKELKTIVGDVRPGKEDGHEQYEYSYFFFVPHLMEYDKVLDSWMESQTLQSLVLTRTPNRAPSKFNLAHLFWAMKETQDSQPELLGL